MPEWLASLAGALIGGFMALAGARWQFRLQRDRDAAVLRATILAELKAGRDVFDRRGSEDVYLELFDAWEATGTVPHARALADVLELEPAATFPVYHARAGDLGVLGERQAAAIIAHYAETIGLMRSSKIIFASMSLEADTSSGAVQLRRDYTRMVESRAALIALLEKRV